MEQPIYALGALRTPPEKLLMARIHAPRGLPGAPQTLDMRPEMQPVRDQGSQGTCVAFAITACMEYFVFHDNNNHIYMSPQFIYNCRQDTKIEGMIPIDACGIMHDVGVPMEKDYPYGKIEARNQILPGVFTAASGWKVGSYAKVLSVDSLKSALSENGPCFITFPVYNYGAAFWQPNGNENEIGGHAVAIVGYTDKAFILRNSWGSGWNSGGYTEYPFTSWGAHWEVWTVIDAPPHPVVKDDPKGGCCKCIVM